MEEATRKPAPPRPEQFAELEEEFQRQQWEAWVDQPVPALNNRTPREAARSAGGRERLEALLADFEWRGGVRSNASERR